MKKTLKLLSIFLIILLAILVATGCNEKKDVKDIEKEVEKSIKKGEYSFVIGNNVTNGDPGLKYAYLEKYDAYAVCGLGEHSGVVVNIPEEVNGKPVIAISKRAFVGDATLQAVSIPDTVQVILSGAFEECSFLSQVTIGTKDSDLQYIQNRIFSQTNVSSVTYKGTMSEWTKMLKDLPDDYLTTWVYNSNHPTISVICDDGTLVYWTNSGELLDKNTDNTKYTVTKDVWNANIDSMNYTFTYNVGQNPNGDARMVTVKQVKNAVIFYDNNYISSFYVIKNSTSYGVTSEGPNYGVWVGYPMEWEPLPWYTYLWINRLEFNDFEYNESRQAYISTKIAGFEAVVKFENGKIISLESIDLDDPSNYTKVTFSNIGNTVVDVPDFTIKSN